MPTLTPIATDNFHRADENPLNPANWELNTNNFALAVVSDACTGGDTNPDDDPFGIGTELYIGAATPDDQYCQITVGQFQISSVIGIAVRTDFTALTGYSLALQGFGDGINYGWEVDAPSGAIGTGVLSAPQPGDVVILSSVGTTITFTYNGVQLMQVTNAETASGLTQLTIVGSSTPGDTTVASFTMGSAANSPAPTGVRMGQPIPATLTNFAGYPLAITSPTTTGFAANPTPIVFTDSNGNEYTVTGATKGTFKQQPIPVVLCDSIGRPIVPPIAITSNGNTITVTSTLTGNKLGQPTPVCLTDPNGNVLSQSGFTYGSETGSPTPVVLCNTNGQPITATIAT